jgi:hypothetical protein
MSRILRRPMFRGGGPVNSYGTGIAAPLVPGYQGGGSINTPRRGLVSLPGGYAGEDQPLWKKLLSFGNAGTSGGIIPVNQNLTKSAASNNDDITTGGEIVQANVKPIVGDFQPKDRKESDDYQDFKINQPDILSETEIEEKVELGKAHPDNKPWYDISWMGMDGLGMKDWIDEMSYGKTEAGQEEYRDELIKINEANKKLYEKYKIPYEGDVSGNLVPPSMRGDGRDLPEKIVIDESLSEGLGLNEEGEESLTIDPKTLMKDNQELFSEMLGLKKARGQDISDMLLRFSGSQGNTLGEKFQNYTAAEAAAGPGRAEQIGKTAAGLSIQDYVAGKRAKEAVELMKSRTDYEADVKKSLLRPQKSDTLYEARVKIAGKDGKVNSNNTIAGIIATATGSNQVASSTAKSLKDATKNLDKLSPGYNIITEKGKKIIVLYDGKGDPNTLQVFSLEDIWNQFKE